MRGEIFDLKEFAVHDGEGIRTTVFLKGCPLRCEWCHNPEGQSPSPQLMQKSGCVNCGSCRKRCDHEECKPFGRCLHACRLGLLSVAGREVDSEELVEYLMRSRDLFVESGGGVTLSGGEPLAQPVFAVDLLKRLEGVNRAIETSGYASADVFKSVLDNVDYVYFDVKIADNNAHFAHTGVSNEPILRNLQILKSSGKPHTVRLPLIPNITDTDENIASVKKIAGDSPLEMLKYNAMAGAKYAMLGREYKLRDSKTIT